MKYLPQSMIIAALTAVVICRPAAAQAQEERTSISITPAAATTGGGSEFAVAATAGYRFSNHLSFEGDFTWIDGPAGGERGRDRVFALGTPQFAGEISAAVSQTIARFGGLNLRNPSSFPVMPIRVEGLTGPIGGRTMISTFGLRYEPTVQTPRFRPYLSAGLGMNRTGQDLLVGVGRPAGNVTESVSHAGIALSAGGGTSIRVFRSVWANADAKYFRLSRDRNVIRFGGGIGVRF